MGRELALGRKFFEHVGDVILELIVHEFHRGVVEHSLERGFGFDSAHALDPGVVVVIWQLALFVAEPDNFKDGELHEDEEVLADFVIAVEFLDIISEDLGERGIVYAHAAELHLQFNEFGEVGNILRLTVVLELDCAIEE